jgi:hypothetical protein
MRKPEFRSRADLCRGRGDLHSFFGPPLAGELHPRFLRLPLADRGDATGSKQDEAPRCRQSVARIRSTSEALTGAG